MSNRSLPRPLLLPELGVPMPSRDGRLPTVGGIISLYRDTNLLVHLIAAKS